MKPKTMILMVVAVTCGLGASYMTSRLLAERETPEVPKVKFLVASKTLNQGDTIKKPEEMFVEKTVPEGEEPKGAIVDLALLKNRIVIRSRRAGDAIFQDDLLDPEKGYGPQGTMPEGYRGYGIRVSAEQIAGGWASLPNSRVDIISTIKGSSHKDSKAMTLLHDVLVIAADQSVGTPDAGKAMLAATVTVAVKPEDVLRLSLAEQYGPLRLVVRKYNDRSRADNDQITFDSVLNGSGQKKDEIETGPPEPPTTVVKIEPPKVETTPKVEPVPVNPQQPQRIEIVEDVKPVRTEHVVTLIHNNRVTYQRYILDEDGNILQYIGPANESPQVPQPTPATGQRKDGP